MRSLYELNPIRRTDKAVMEMWGTVGDDRGGCFETVADDDGLDDPTARSCSG